MKNLIKVTRILLEDYEYVKNDQDILDQMLKVLNKDYKVIKRKLNNYRRYGIDLDLDEVLYELEEKYQELKQERKCKRKSYESSNNQNERTNYNTNYNNYRKEQSYCTPIFNPENYFILQNPYDPKVVNMRINNHQSNFINNY